MNTLSSTIESAQNASTFVDGEYSCAAVDKSTGLLCGETESLRIMEEFKKLYETRVENVDREFETEHDRTSVKLEIMKDWIKDLMQQNITLVQIVEDLEQTACDKVKLLEEKLRQSAMIVSENITSSHRTEKTINTLSNRIDDLVKNEKYMKQKIEFLQSDIRGLLELIRRSVQDNHWSLDGIKFLEIKPDNIPIPLNYNHDQEETNHKKIQTLTLQIEHLHRNEKKMIQHQKELEDTLTDLNAKLETKEKTIKRYVYNFQNVTDNLRKHAKFGSLVDFESFRENGQESVDIMLMSDIVENILIQKDLEIRKLQQRSNDVSSNLEKFHDTRTDLDNLKIQLKDKCWRIEELEQQMDNLQKEALEKQDALTVEIIENNELITSLQDQIVALQKQYDHATIQIQFKKDIIKEMRKKLKQTIAKGTLKICVASNACQEEFGAIRYPINQEIICLLNKVKSFMEQEHSDVNTIKAELEKTMEQLYCEKDKGSFKNNKEFSLNDIRHKLGLNIDCLNRMCLKREDLILSINSVLKMEYDPIFMETNNLSSCGCVDQQMKLMDILNACTLEARITTEDIKEEMKTIVSSFESRHQKYINLNKEVTNVQNQIIRSQIKITETINRLHLQEEERTRHNERINVGKIKLKDIKDEINHARSRLSIGITKVENATSEKIICNYTDIGMCNDLLCSVIEEMEQTSNSLQIFQNQGCCMASDLGELKCQLCDVDISLKQLQQKMDEALMEHDTVETTLFHKEQKLEKLENEVDIIHSKIQNTLETFIIDNNVSDSQLYTQALNEILRAKQDLSRLKKEHEELKHKISQKNINMECNERNCSWKYKVTDLQSQVELLQHETKCKQEANDCLRNNIEFMEKDLHAAQEKAENYRRSSSMNCIEFERKITELENVLKSQKEIEFTLRQQLYDGQVELKNSAELLNSFYTECSIGGPLLHSGSNQFVYEVPTMTVHQLFKTLESKMQSTKCGLQELRFEMNSSMREGALNIITFKQSFADVVQKLHQFEYEMDTYFQEIGKMKMAVDSKDKLLANQEKIIQIQKNSIEMTQDELKQLHQKLQEKINKQDQLISHCENEKKELIKQNEFQIQTIGHLQNALVEAKRCIDQMGHRTMSDLEEKNETIRLLTVYVEETQSQYNDCFSEAAKQDKLLELQRNVIYDLQRKIQHTEYDNNLIVNSIHVVYYSIFKTIQEHLHGRASDLEALKCQVDTLVQSKCCFENKYLKKLCQESEEKLQELRQIVMEPQQKVESQEDKACQCNQEVSYEHDLEAEIDILSRENEDIKRQLQKYKFDFDTIRKELKIERESDTYTQQISLELHKMKDNEFYLCTENEKLKSDLKKLKISKDTQTQAEIIKDLEKKLCASNQKADQYLSELNEVEEVVSNLHSRIRALKITLTNKSDELAKLQADYEILKNDNSILKTEICDLENRVKKDACHMKDIRMHLCYVENNYHKVTEDFNKTQAQLITSTKREADLQECLTKMEKEYYSKVTSLEKEKVELADCLEKLRYELEELQRNYSSKNSDHCKLQDICKSYADQLDVMQHQIEKERDNVQQLEESNHCTIKKLQECMEQNCALNKDKLDIISQLEETHKSLLELKKECQLKNKSLACISAELTETAMSRSKVCTQSQYVVSCIRTWMEEQREFVNKLNLKLKCQQQQLSHLGTDKKSLLDESKKLKRINHLLTQRLKRMHEHKGKNINNVCVRCRYGTEQHIPINSKCLHPEKKFSLTKTARRVSACGNAWYLPKMEYLINELRKSNIEYSENFSNRENTDIVLEESRDCGYQSSTSK